MIHRVDSADVATARPPSFRAMEGTTNPRDGREASAAVTAARGAHQAAAGSGGATSPRSQGVSSGSPPSPRGGIMSRVWEKLSGSPPKGADSLPSSPPSPGRAMKGQDVWEKGTGVTRFKGSDRYDKPAPLAAGVHRAPSVEEILAPCYSTGRGPPSYESKESYDKGPMVPQ